MARVRFGTDDHDNIIWKENNPKGIEPIDFITCPRCESTIVSHPKEVCEFCVDGSVNIGYID